MPLEAYKHGDLPIGFSLDRLRLRQRDNVVKDYCVFF